MENEIVIEHKSDINQLMKVSKYLLLNLRFVKFIPIFILALILIKYLPDLSEINQEILEKNYNTENQNYILSEIVPFLLISIIWIFIGYRTLNSMKKNILSNKKNFEKQKITFTKKSYLQEGETFKIENFWNEMYQIKETKSWFLLYPKKNSAFPIIKSDLKDNQYNELKGLFNSLNIKKSLK